MTRAWWRELGAVIVQTGILGWAAVLLAGFFDRAITAWTTFAVAAVVVVAGHVQRRLRERTEMAPAGWADERFARPFARIGVLRQQVEWGLESAQRFGQVLQPTVSAIAGDRLRRKHGIDPAVDPDRCRELLGDDLWQLVTGTATELPTVADLERLVGRIEKL